MAPLIPWWEVPTSSANLVCCMIMTKAPRSSNNRRHQPYPIMSITSDTTGSLANYPQDSSRSTAAWSVSDDARLMQCRAQGMNWGPIAGQFPSKTPNACRKRHERLMEKKNAESWDGVKIEDLARAYLECREEMWKLVAEKIGEKWQLVETKVLVTCPSVSRNVCLLDIVYGKGPQDFDNSRTFSERQCQTDSKHEPHGQRIRWDHSG